MRSNGIDVTNNSSNLWKVGSETNKRNNQTNQHGEVDGTAHQEFNIGTLKMWAFVDSSFANFDDISTQLGYARLLTDTTNRVSWTYFGSSKFYA